MSTENTSTFEEVSQYFTADIPDDLKNLVADAIEREFDNKRRLREQLIKEMAIKEPKFFYQLDGFANMPPDDCAGKPDGDGDVLIGGSTWELRRTGNEVRVLIHEGTKPKDVLRLLKKLRQWIKKRPELITNNENRNKALENAGRYDDQDDDIPF